VLFSGDKLLGGPQAGIIAGAAEAVTRIRRHPLMRALRVDKMTYAALEATLQEYAAGRATETVPVARMLAMTHAEVSERTERLIAAIAGSSLSGEALEGTSTIGGGSAPGSSLSTRLVALSHRSKSANELDAQLRGGSPPVVARIQDGRLLIDLRTVLPEEERALIEILRRLGQ
ncbi:MAG: aminotransferase class V-fold PLP-dependent enzyme, partial [Vicinamibacterales bacterium]